MTNETILSRRLALGRIGAIALAAFAVPTVLTATKTFAEDGKNGDGDAGGDGGGDKNGGGDTGGDGDGGKDGGGDTGGDGGDDKNGGDGGDEKNGGTDDSTEDSSTSGNRGSDSSNAGGSRSDSNDDESPAKSIASLFKRKRKGK